MEWLQQRYNYALPLKLIEYSNEFASEVSPHEKVKFFSALIILLTLLNIFIFLLDIWQMKRFTKVENKSKSLK